MYMHILPKINELRYSVLRKIPVKLRLFMQVSMTFMCFGERHVVHMHAYDKVSMKYVIIPKFSKVSSRLTESRLLTVLK